MSPKAEEAFADYVAMDKPRAYARLAEARVRQGHGTSTAAQTRRLEKWSVEYGWQERLRRISEALLNEVTEIRAEVVSRIVREYDRRTRKEMAAAMKLHDLHGVYDRVKFPDPQRITHEGNPDAPIVFNFIRDGGDRADE